MSLIKRESIETLKQQCDILNVFESLGAHVEKRGSRYFCKSLFNEEKTASCCIDEVKQRFTDYSADKNGDAITLLMDLKHFSYPEAVKWLADHFNISLEYEDEKQAAAQVEKIKAKESLRPYLEAALRHFRNAFKELPEDHPAKKEVLEHREYTDEVCSEWNIGYAPGGTYIVDKLKEVKDGSISFEKAEELFLIGKKKDSKSDAYHDKYWNRVIYPIYDRNNLIIGFAGRDLSGKEKTAKWLNSANTPLYQNEKVWFGLNQALNSIRKKGEAWIVEGYNDVIAWHRFGITNTISSCGTKITPMQMHELKKYTKDIILCFDGDKAGRKAISKYTQEFMQNGFTVYVILLPEIDPDDFVREKHMELNDTSLEALVSAPNMKIHGFKFLMSEMLDRSDEFKINESARSLCKIIASIDDYGQSEILWPWLAKETKIEESQIKAWTNNFIEKNNAHSYEEAEYEFPKGIKIDKESAIPVIQKYGLFIAADRIWIKGGDERPYFFIQVSNFSIEIIQHMHDEKLPMKLVRIRNIEGHERIFDLPSIEMNTPMAFDNAMTNHGNFQWYGGRNEFQKLRRYLFDRMGVGTKIEVLGWQAENFWVWNNAITVPGEGNLEIDENGVFKRGSISYYIPSANQIYEHNSFKYTPQKKVKLLRSDVSFSGYCNQMIKVHREHAITAILFTVGSVFLDIIEDDLGNFPLLFLYGPASTGKDQLIDCCQSWFGQPQSPIHIGNKVSTQKAQIRKFAQFKNMIVHLSEYRPGDNQMDEMLKGFWDRRGYERGTIDSAYGTETVPISSSVIFTGNHYPDDDALITRMICEQMTKTDFSAAEKKEYQNLKDMTKKGVSYLVAELLQHRGLIADKFKETFRKVEKELKQDLGIAVSQERMISNVAVLAAIYELLKDKVTFPFNLSEYASHIRTGLEAQERKLNTASVHSKWWDCFLSSIRTKSDPIIHGREFKVEDGKLFFNFTHTYNRVSMQWWNQYHESVPTKHKISDVIKKDTAFIEEKKSVRMDTGRKSNNTSAWVMNLDNLPIYDDLMESIEWQQKEGRDMPVKADNPYNQPAMNFNSKPNDNPDDLPF